MHELIDRDLYTHPRACMMFAWLQLLHMQMYLTITNQLHWTTALLPTRPECGLFLCSMPTANLDGYDTSEGSSKQVLVRHISRCFQVDTGPTVLTVGLLQDTQKRNARPMADCVDNDNLVLYVWLLWGCAHPVRFYELLCLLHALKWHHVNGHPPGHESSY